MFLREKNGNEESSLCEVSSERETIEDQRNNHQFFDVYLHRVRKMEITI